MMNKSSLVFVAGHQGLVGSAILETLYKKGYSNFITRSYAELDLTDQHATLQFFEKEKPEYIFLAAAKVGGIMANNTFRAQFIYENIQIQNNVIHSAWLSGAKKLLFLGSSCIYPRSAPQPLKEEYLLTDELEYTNEPYALAKIAGIRMIESYNLQYGTNYLAVMPTNLYGLNDNFHLNKSHVLPAMIRKMHLAKCLDRGDLEAIRADIRKRPMEEIDDVSSVQTILEFLGSHGITKSGNATSLTLWGSGAPMREFLWANDMADACVYVMENVDFKDLIGKNPAVVRNTHINIGSGKEISIRDLALLVRKIIGFEGEVAFDASKPDGTPRKLLDVRKLNQLGWKYEVELEQGIRMVYDHYLS